MEGHSWVAKFVGDTGFLFSEAVVLTPPGCMSSGILSPYVSPTILVM